MQNTDKLIFVGFISSCSGIKGDVAVKSYTANPKDLCDLTLFTQDDVRITLKLIRQNTNGDLVCKLNDTNDRNAAEGWLKQKLYCLRSSLPQVTDGEFYIEDLKNLDVLNDNGDKIGTILGVYNFGAGDIIEIKLISEEIIMLPFNNNFFPHITHEFVVCANVNNKI